MLSFALLLAATQPDLPCAGRGSAQVLHLSKGGTHTLHLPASARTSVLFVQENGADVELELVDGQKHLFADAAPSRAALERMLVPAALEGAKLLIHNSSRFESKNTITVWRVCGAPAAPDVQFARAAHLLAASERENFQNIKQTLRAQAIEVLEVLALNPHLSTTERAQLAHNLGFLYRRESLFKAAQLAYTQAEASWRGLSIPLAQTNAQLEIVKLLLQQQQFELARKKVIEASLENSDSIYAARLEHDRCAIDLYLGESAERLLRCFRSAEIRATRALDDTSRLGAMYNQAQQLLKLGQGASARRILDAIESSATRDSEPTLMARSYHLRALISLALGELDTAIHQMQKTIRYAATAGTAEIQCDALRGLAQVYLQLGDRGRALTLLTQASQLAKTHALGEQQNLLQLLVVEHAIVSKDAAGAREQLAMVFANLPADVQQTQSLRLALAFGDTTFLEWLDTRAGRADLSGAAIAARFLRKRGKAEFTAELENLSSSETDRTLLLGYIRKLAARDRGYWLALLTESASPVIVQFLEQEFNQLLLVGKSVQDPVVLSAWLGCFESFAQGYISRLAQLDPDLAWNKLSGYAGMAWGGYRSPQPDRQMAAYRDLFQVMTHQTGMPSEASASTTSEVAEQTSSRVDPRRVNPSRQHWADACQVTLAWVESDYRTGFLLQRNNRAQWIALNSVQDRALLSQLRQSNALEYPAAQNAYAAAGAMLEQIGLLANIAQGEHLCWIEGFNGRQLNWALVQLRTEHNGTQYWVQRNPMFSSVGTTAKLARVENPKFLFLSNSQSALPAIALERSALLSAFPKRSITIRTRFDAVDQVVPEPSQRFTHLHFSGHGATEFNSEEGKLLLGSGDALGYFDIVQKSFAPETVVLSTCFGAAPSTQRFVQLHPASAFLRRGANVVIAATQAIPDQQTALFFAAFYQALARTASPLGAFHQAQLSALASPHMRDPRPIMSLQLWVQ